MMWSIFLLSFCAFQMVFADKLADDIEDSTYPLYTELVLVSYKPNDEIVAACQAVKVEGISWIQIDNKCTNTDYDKRFKKSCKTKTKQCKQCYHKVKNTEDIQTAETCCKKLIAELKKDVEEYIAQVKTCITKCVESSTECRKEITNLQKMQENWYQDIPAGLPLPNLSTL